MIAHRTTRATSNLPDLERQAAFHEQRCHRFSGLEGYETARNKYAGVLLEIQRHRPLSVYELMNCGVDYAEACRVADATGGERTDRTLAPDGE